VALIVLEGFGAWMATFDGQVRASAPIPKFASFCGTLVCELRNRRTLATYRSSVALAQKSACRTRGRCAIGSAGHIPDNRLPVYRQQRTFVSAVGTSVQCRLCCKSLKTPGDKFPARSRNKPRSLIDVASGSLPKSPVSLSPSDEVPHIFTRKPRLQPEKFAINGAKRLLQHNLPVADTEW
jgi:hypothetical protein